MKHLDYSTLKSMSRDLFGAEFPWEFYEANKPLMLGDKDTTLLLLLWDAFTYEVRTAPAIPTELAD